MNFSFYIAKRYVFSKSKSNAINIISKIAFIGIVIGTLALFVVLSVFSGLRDYSVQFTNDYDPDLKILPINGKSFELSVNQENLLKKIDEINLFSKIVEERVLFSFKGKQQVCYLKGVDSSFTKANKIKKSLFNGQWIKPNSYEAVVGYGIANKLSLGILDYNNLLEVFVPRAGKGTIETESQGFNKEFLLPVGIYSISEDLDAKYVFVDLALSQQLLDFKENRITGVEINCKNNFNEEQVISKIQKIFNDKVIVKTRSQLNATLHKMLNTENIAVYLIFTLVIIIALFNLIGSLIMIILDKKENLKTLFNLGVEQKKLKQIFLLQGIIISFFGAILGLFLGSIFVFLQQKFSLIMITDSLAYPVVFEIKNIIIVFFTIFILGLLSSYIASSRINKNTIFK